MAGSLFWIQKEKRKKRELWVELARVHVAKHVLFFIFEQIKEDGAWEWACITVTIFFA